MGATKHFFQTFKQPAKATSLHPNLAGFVRVGDILNNPRYLYEMKERFKGYDFAKAPKESK